MAETIRAFVGVKDVYFAVTDEGSRSVRFLDRLDEDVVTEEIVHTDADGGEDVFAYTSRVSRRVTVHSKDLTALEALTVNSIGTLTWTLVGKGVAPDRTVNSPARVVRPVALGSGDGSEPVVGSVVFQLLHEPGSEDAA